MGCDNGCMTDTFRVEDLLTVYGADFLGFILDEDPENVSRRVTEGSFTLTAEKETALSEFVTLEAFLGTLPEARRGFERSLRLSIYSSQVNGTMTSYLRRICGGMTTLPPANDDVESFLLHFAEVSYPLRLQNDRDGETSSVRMPWQDPMREQLQAAVMADDMLSKLYPDNSEHSGPVGSTIRSTGSGGGIQLWMFIESVTTAAWQYAHFGRAQPTFDEYTGATLKIVRTLRAALQGKNSTVPMRIGLAGVLLPEGIDSVDLGWARIRRSDERDSYFSQRTSIDDQLHFTNAAGESIMIDYAGNLVLELDVPYKVLLRDHRIADPWPDEITQTHLVAEPIECLRLGLLLGGIGEHATAAPTWQSIVDPLAGVESIGWNDPRRGVNLLPMQLTEQQVDIWKEWAARIHDHRTPQIGVSIRRILRAVSERKEPEDTLIDAVIVWENFFGAAQETTLRVTMSVAWVLGSDAKGRQTLVKELKQIYQQRSGIVHGNAKLKTEKTSAFARRAIEISIELLKVIFENRPKLLKLRSGDERSNLVLLDAVAGDADAGA